MVDLRPLAEFVSRPAPRGLMLAGLLLVLLLQSPFFVRGERSYVRVHDNLDANHACLAALAEPGSWEDDGRFRMMLGGMPAEAFSFEPRVTSMFYRLFPPFWAYVVNDMVVRWIAFAGMYLLLRRLLPGLDLLSALVGLAFAMLPFFGTHGLSVPGQPGLAVVVLTMLDRASSARGRAAALLYTVLFAFYSSFAYIGVFVLIPMGVIWAGAVWVRRRLELRLLVCMVLLGACYAAACSPFLSNQLSREPIRWHREQFDLVRELRGLKLAREAARLVKRSHAHADSNPFPILWGTLFLALVSAGAANRSQRADRTATETSSGPDADLDELALSGSRGVPPELVTLCGALLGLGAAGAAYFFYLHPAYAELSAEYPLLRSFNFSRWYWLMPLLFYVGFHAALRLIARGSEAMVLVALSIAVVQVVSNVNDREWRERSREDYVRYSEFRSSALFDRLETLIGRDRSEVRLATFGLYPSIPMLNGFATVGGYWYLYPLDYKIRFREVIAKELERSQIYRDYFDRWGSRCYLFSSELGPRNLVRKDEPLRVQDLRIDVAALSSLGGDFLISAVSIENWRELGLAYLDALDDEGSLLHLHVYAVPSPVVAQLDPG